MFEGLWNLVSLLPPMWIRITPMYLPWTIITIGVAGLIQRYWRR